MAVLLMRLRLVPDDELSAIEDLLQQRDIAYYTTGAGTFGISLPALWLVDASRLDEASGLLEDFARHRQAEALALQQALRDAGRARTMLDIARERPLRFVLYVALVAALVALSIVPFVRLH